MPKFNKKINRTTSCASRYRVNMWCKLLIRSINAELPFPTSV